VTEVLAGVIGRIEQAGGIAIVNHPNFWESISINDLLALRALTHLEIFNGHPLTFSQGTETLPDMETVWDRLLGAGRRVWGVAVDDGHDYTVWGSEHRNPGRGWVMVQAPSLEDRAIVDALAQGRFYPSTGPSFVTMAVTDGALEVVAEAPGSFDFVVNGKQIKTTFGTSGRELLPPSGYIRARFTDGSGRAWTQPVFVP
jgi:hypothetical protein